MSGELMRYNNHTNLTKATEARRTIDGALARLRQVDPGPLRAEAMQRAWPHNPSQVIRNAGAVVDVARVCAVHDRYYVSRYVQDANGFFHYGQSIRITKSNSQQYMSEADNRRSIPNEAIDDETCPWCGAEGFASILCADCKYEVCYGRTIAKQFFHCRESCGSSGTLSSVNRPINGLTPCLTSPSIPYSSGR